MRFGKTIAVFLILLLAVSANVFGQEERKIKMDEYQAQLAEVQTRESGAQEKITALDAEIDELKKQIDETQAQIDDTWAELYGMVGTDKAGVEAYHNELASISSELDGLAALSPEDLFRRKQDLKALAVRIEEARSSKIALLTEMDNKVAELEGQMAGLKNRMPANIYDQYTVLNGDYLWKISKKEDVYGDPFQWIRIYSVNKDQIKDPDLIYMGQIFNIARGVGDNEYLVVKGDFLYKIAGMAKVYGDPTKWTKLYEANKDLISDPSLIYPHQVLSIPEK